ncbi:MAG: hypothetical protein HYY04_06395 [Chloroflexi bacterium]|nr:hypothetical protein [Chloroflexota bacterium]
MATLVQGREIIRTPTPRVRRLLDRYLHADIQVCVQRARSVTEQARREAFPFEPAIVRHARRLAHILENLDITIWPDELIVGAPTSKHFGAFIYPELGDLGIGRSSPDDDPDRIGGRVAEELRHIRERDHIPMLATDEEIAEIAEIARFWPDRGIGSLVDRYLPPTVAALSARDGLFSRGFVAHTHMVVNVSRILTLGCAGVIAGCDAKLAEQDGGRLVPAALLETRSFYQAVKIACQGLMTYARRCARKVREAAATEPDPVRRAELEQIAAICERVPAKPARTFHEALQSQWFLQIGIVNEDCLRGMDPGRMDQYLFPFYERDVAAGLLTEDQAVELLSCLWLKMSQFLDVRRDSSDIHGSGLGGRHAVTIGGAKPDGSDATNALTFLVLRSVGEVKSRQPNLCARLHRDSPAEYRDALGEVIKTGGGLPGLFNDERIVPMLAGRGLAMEDARDYAMVGCVEPVSAGRTCGGTAVARVNLAMALELALYDGDVPYYREQIGPRTGDPATFTSIDQVVEAFRQQVAFLVEKMMLGIHALHLAHRDYHPDPLFSVVLDDCLERGLDNTRGGGRYSLAGITSLALIDVGDSLAAIDQLVFEERSVTMAELLQALRDNFVGHEWLHQTIMNRVPKYGNDVDAVDRFTRMVGEILGREIRKYPNPIDPRGGFTAGMWSMTTHTRGGWGQYTGALPSGRKAGEGFTNGVSPMDGQERKGPTAVLRSGAKLNYDLLDNGVALNQKFTPSTLAGPTGTRILSGMIQAYFALGGQQVQYNVVDRAMLLDAQKNPGRYPGLLVRVSGYSAHFVHLNKEMQDEIINRTEFSV